MSFYIYGHDPKWMKELRLKHPMLPFPDSKFVSRHPLATQDTSEAAAASSSDAALTNTQILPDMKEWLPEIGIQQLSLDAQKWYNDMSPEEQDVLEQGVLAVVRGGLRMAANRSLSLTRNMLGNTNSKWKETPAHKKPTLISSTTINKQPKSHNNVQDETRRDQLETMGKDSDGAISVDNLRGVDGDPEYPCNPLSQDQLKTMGKGSDSAISVDNLKGVDGDPESLYNPLNPHTQYLRQELVDEMQRNPQAWLSDILTDAARNTINSQLKESKIKAHIVSSVPYTAFHGDGQNPGYNPNEKRKVGFAKKLGGISNMHRLSQIINCGRVHWVVGMCDFQRKMIGVIDPFGPHRPELVPDLKKWLSYVILKTEDKVLDFSGWTSIPADEFRFEPQRDAFNCGVYSIVLATIFVRQGKGFFSYKDVCKLRYRLLDDLCNASVADFLSPIFPHFVEEAAQQTTGLRPVAQPVANDDKSAHPPPEDLCRNHETTDKDESIFVANDVAKSARKRDMTQPEHDKPLLSRPPKRIKTDSKAVELGNPKSNTGSEPDFNTGGDPDQTQFESMGGHEMIENTPCQEQEDTEQSCTSQDAFPRVSRIASSLDSVWPPFSSPSAPSIGTGATSNIVTPINENPGNINATQLFSQELWPGESIVKEDILSNACIVRGPTDTFYGWEKRGTELSHHGIRSEYKFVLVDYIFSNFGSVWKDFDFIICGGCVNGDWRNMEVNQIWKQWDATNFRDLDEEGRKKAFSSDPASVKTEISTKAGIVETSINGTPRFKFCYYQGGVKKLFPRLIPRSYISMNRTAVVDFIYTNYGNEWRDHDSLFETLGPQWSIKVAEEVCKRELFDKADILFQTRPSRDLDTMYQATFRQRTGDITSKPMQISTRSRIQIVMEVFNEYGLDWEKYFIPVPVDTRSWISSVSSLFRSIFSRKERSNLPVVFESPDRAERAVLSDIWENADINYNGGFYSLHVNNLDAPPLFLFKRDRSDLVEQISQLYGKDWRKVIGERASPYSLPCSQRILSEEELMAATDMNPYQLPVKFEWDESVCPYPTEIIKDISEVLFTTVSEDYSKKQSYRRGKDSLA